MRPCVRFALLACTLITFASAGVASVRAEEAGRVEHDETKPARVEREEAKPARTEHDEVKPAHVDHEEAKPTHACLNQKERRAEMETGHLVRLDVAMRVARGRMPGTVVGARLCRSPNGLLYVLTVLAHDGKVARLTVDAVKGTLVGGL
jgi:uncharacterized membrane protein YkoI